VSVDLGPVGLMADGRGGWYWSIDAGDPAQSEIRRNVLLHDTRYYATVSMWTRPLVAAFRFGLAYQHVWRTSSMAETTVKATESDILGAATVLF
jgi:hypothetical protein